MSKRFDISVSDVVSNWEKLGSMNAVARKLGCSVAMVKSRLQKAGITCSHSDGASRRYAVEAEQQWKDIYADAYSGMSFPDLVKKHRMTRERLRSLFEKHGFDYESRLAEIKSEARAGYGETLKQMRESGMSVKEMAESLGKSMKTVSRDLLSFGLTKSAARSDISDEEVLADFNSGLTIVEIARKRGCSHDTITKRLKRFGISCSRTEGIYRHFKREQTRLWPEIEKGIKSGMSVAFISEKYGMTSRTVHNLAAAHGYAMKPGVDCTALNQKLTELLLDDSFASGLKGSFARTIKQYYDTHGTVPSAYDIARMRGICYGYARPALKRFGLSGFVNLSNQGYAVSKLVSVFDDFGIEYSLNNREILIPSDGGRPLEIDIWLPGQNFGIEVNPAYTHSVDFSRCRLDDLYHQHKSLLAEKAGIGLVHVYDDDLFDSRRWAILVEQILSRYEKRMHIGARACVVHVVDNHEAGAFLNRFHFQGSVNGHVTHYGLFYGDELISCLSVSRSRYTDHDFEIVRYCTQPSYVVAGGFRKLLCAFLRTLDHDADIVSYLDLNKRFSAENLYERSGFEFEALTPPDYAWYDRGGRECLSRYMTQKSRLVAEGFDASKTEVEIMTERGFGRVFKAGSKRYVYHFKFAGKD